jgi:hypothetical protein
MRVRLVGEQPEVAAAHAPVPAYPGIVVEQRHQLRIVAGLAGGQLDRDRGLTLVGQGVDLRGEPASRTADRVVAGLIGSFLVIRQCPLWQACPSAHLRSVDVPARSSNPPTATSRYPQPCRRRTRTPPQPGRTSCRRYHPATIDDGASTPSAKVRNRPAGHATGCRCGTAMRSLPASTDGHRTCCLACPHSTASPTQQPPTTRQKSHPFASPANSR